MTTSCIDRFHLSRDASGAYVSVLMDDWDFTIALQAEVVERDEVKVSEGTGTLTNTPRCDAKGSSRRDQLGRARYSRKRSEIIVMRHRIT